MSKKTINGSEEISAAVKNIKTNQNVAEKQKRQFIVKEFKERPSYLTHLMLEVDHVKAIYHICIVCLLLMSLHSCCHDYLTYGRIKLGYDTFKYSFGGLHYTLALLFAIHLVLIALFYGWKLWAFVWLRICKSSFVCALWSLICLSCYIGAQLIMVYVITLLRLQWQLKLISAFVLFLETTRLLMKLHAFVRTNCGLVLGLATKSAPWSEFTYPKLTSFLYFLFAPTLLYRNSYPRSKHIRWSFAAKCLFEIIAVAYFFACIYEQHMSVHFMEFGKQPVTPIELIGKIYSMLLPCSFILLGFFYIVLHAVQNLGAELLRFGDRLFYTDWWNGASYGVYFRRWNILVQEWLFEFIYKDFYCHIFRGSKTLSSLAVFLISALVHEYILGYSMLFCYPVMFVLFMFTGVPMALVLRSVPKVPGNIFLWFSFLLGNAVMMSLYSMEYNARRNLNQTFSKWQDTLAPASWSVLSWSKDAVIS